MKELVMFSFFVKIATLVFINWKNKTKNSIFGRQLKYTGNFLRGLIHRNGRGEGGRDWIEGS